MHTHTHKDNILKQLSVRFPSIAFAVSREIDYDFQWDGEGDAPENMSAYIVAVSASAVLRGEVVTCETYLGGCYYEADEPIGDIHGYFLQQAKESVSQLAKMARCGAPPIHAEALDASKWIDGEMGRRYYENMAEKA
jgi:hypothetical protein